MKSEIKTIAVFGSAFNPAHCGHVDVVKQVAEIVDLVLLVPSYCHAFGKSMGPFNHRLTMAESMAQGLILSAKVRVSDIERRLSLANASDGATNIGLRPVYSYDVLCALEATYPGAKLMLTLGPDNADPAMWKRFYRSQEILDRWGVWVAQERVAVRSTQIRAKLAKGELPTEAECPASVIELLKKPM